MPSFPEVFRLDQVTALKPLLTDVGKGRLSVPEAELRLTTIENAPAPYASPSAPSACAA